jgi:hypothetical protein
MRLMLLQYLYVVDADTKKLMESRKQGLMASLKRAMFFAFL